MNEEHQPLLERIKGVLSDRVETVHVSRRLVDSPACVVAADDDLNPQLRRMLEASGQEIPETKPILEINVEHPLVSRLAAEADEQRFEGLSNIVLDHALTGRGIAARQPGCVRAPNEQAAARSSSQETKND